METVCGPCFPKPKHVFHSKLHLVLSSTFVSCSIQRLWQSSLQPLVILILTPFLQPQGKSGHDRDPYSLCKERLWTLQLVVRFGNLTTRENSNSVSQDAENKRSSLSGSSTQWSEHVPLRPLSDDGYPGSRSYVLFGHSILLVSSCRQ